MLNGLCALISVARRREGGDDDGGAGGSTPDGDAEVLPAPFLRVALHLWIRELRRMVCSLHEEPHEGSVEESADMHEEGMEGSERSTGGASEDRMESVEISGGGACGDEAQGAAAASAGGSGTSESNGRAAPRRLRYSDDLQPDEASVHLPLIQCRECRVTGWGAVKRAAEARVELDLRVFYNRFFARDIDVQYLFPAEAPPGARGVHATVCGACGMLHGRGGSTCPGCRSERLVRVFRPDAVVGRRERKSRAKRLSRDCPYCGAREALIILGGRAASLLSVALGEACGSRYNEDRKVIAFSDNVQDAAHRGGFFSARTWRNSVRAGVAQVIVAHEGLALANLPERVEAWWTDTNVNPGAFDPERFVSEFIAPDRQWLRDFVALQREGRLPAGSNLPALVARRLRWEALAELGYASAIGRTLERTRAGAVGVDRAALGRACNDAHVRIREEFGAPRGLEPASVRALILGVLRRMKDRGAISLRIDQGYRAIVLKSDRGNVHLLLWADKHDEAYEWAARHECRINAETGALQVYEPQAEAPGESEGEGERRRPGEPTATRDVRLATTTDVPSANLAFRELKDRELGRLGVPSAMLVEVRAVRSEADLDAMQARLPVEAYEALFLYLAGDTYEKLVLEREAPQEPVDTGDFAKALQRVESRGRFVVAEDELELEAMLNAPLERWRVFLHPSQRRLVERRWNGAVRVLGGAGTGKTVVAMHRARWLARTLLALETPDTRHVPHLRDAPEGGRRRILFTTFTRNLAADIEHNLRAICSPEEMARIEVTNLDRWVARFLRGRRYEFRVVYGRDREAWERALDLKPPDLDFPDTFYADEWEQVVQANAITTKDEYLRVPRLGRGTRLNRAARAKVWRVFEEHRVQLAERGLKEVDDAYRDAATLLQDGRSGLDYAAGIVDEAQDMGAQSWRLIRKLVPEGPDDLFIAGDGHQRIYGRNRVILGRCGIDIRGRSRKLRLNYRTTEETRRWAARLLAGRAIDDLDGGGDDDRGIKSLTRGPEPRLRHFASREEQTAFLVGYLKDLQDGGEPLRSVCVVARTRRERDAVAGVLAESDLACRVLGAGTIDEGEEEGARLATMHRVKGLEFDRVVMAGVNDGLVPLPAAVAGRGDAVERESAETGERALVYVAATRAKKELLVLSFGRPSRFI